MGCPSGCGASFLVTSNRGLRRSAMRCFWLRGSGRRDWVPDQVNQSEARHCAHCGARLRTLMARFCSASCETAWRLRGG